MTIGRNQRLGLVLLCLLMSMAGLAWGQPMSPETPSESPLWWTLSPEFQPEDLRAAYADRQSSLDRYMEAVDAGLETPLSDEELAQLQFYEHPDLHPLVTPMWLAANILATSTATIYGEDTIARELRDFQVSEGGVHKVLQALARLASDEEHLVAEVGPRQIEMQLIAEEIKGQGASAIAVERALEEKDSAFFVGKGTSRSRDQLDTLLASLHRNPPAEASAVALTELRGNLSDADWESFRRYLLKVVVPRTGASTEFRSQEEQ